MQVDEQKNNDILKQELHNLHMTLDHIGAYVYIKDLEGKYTYVNELVRKLFDYPMDEIIGYDDSKFFELELSNDIRINDQKVMGEGKTIEVEEKNIIIKTGEIRYYQTVKKPLYDEHKTITGMFGVSTDITEHKEMQLELTRKQELFCTVLNHVDAFIYMKDRDFRYLYLNPKTANLFDKSPEEVIGKREEEFLDGVHFREMDTKIFETGDVQRGEENFVSPEGILHHYWSVKVPIKDSNGEVNSFIGISTDITQLSTLDALTGIKNRRTLDVEIRKIFLHYKRNARKYCVIMGDVDHFKQINDNYGHFEGDLALQTVSKVIQNNIRAVDVFGRWGGEEFLIICYDTDTQAAYRLAEKLRLEIQKVSSDLEFDLSISFGISEVSEDDTDPFELVKRSDENLYKAKENGRNRVVS